MKHCGLTFSLVFGLSVAFSSAGTAKADSFLFQAAGSGINVQATLTGVADPYTAGAFDITGGSGEVNGVALKPVTPSGNSQDPQTINFLNPSTGIYGSYTYDNVIYLSPANSADLLLDENGLLFAEANDYLNVFAQGAYSYSDDEIKAPYSSPLTSVTVTPVAATPEPGSIAFLGTGLLGMVGVLRRRRS